MKKRKSTICQIACEGTKRDYVSESHTEWLGYRKVSSLSWRVSTSTAIMTDENATAPGSRVHAFRCPHCGDLFAFVDCHNWYGRFFLCQLDTRAGRLDIGNTFPLSEIKDYHGERFPFTHAIGFVSEKGKVYLDCKVVRWDGVLKYGQPLEVKRKISQFLSGADRDLFLAGWEANNQITEKKIVSFLAQTGERSWQDVCDYFGKPVDDFTPYMLLKTLSREGLLEADPKLGPLAWLASAKTLGSRRVRVTEKGRALAQEARPVPDVMFAPCVCI